MSVQTFVRFAFAGATGYVVNLMTYAAAVHAAHADYRVAAVAAFSLALATTFAINRRYTFASTDGTFRRQVPRYVAVCLAAFAVNLLALQVLVDGAHVAKVIAQAIAILIAAPVNFVGQRLWAFAPDTRQVAEATPR